MHVGWRAVVEQCPFPPGIDYPVSADVTYNYGDPGATENRAGRISSVANGDIMEERFYGKLGETVKTVKSIRSDVPSREWPLYTTEYIFDSMGRMRQLTYPDGEVLTYNYDLGGLLESASGVKSGREYIYLNDISYDEYGQRVRLDLGNDVVTRYQYDEKTRRLEHILTLSAEGEVLQNIDYKYDLVGNITDTENAGFVTRDDTPRTVTQSYGYDDLHRLISAGGAYAIGNDHLDKYRNDFIYDSIGNFTNKDQQHWYENALDGSKSARPHTSYNYDYSYTGPQPHAPTQVDAMNHKYDANGNLALRTEDKTGKQRIINWTEENRIASILDQGKETLFRYDDAGTRIVKRGKYGEIVYVDPNFSIRNGEVASKHIFDGNTRIATKLVMKENRAGASKKTYIRPEGSKGHSGSSPEKSRGNHNGTNTETTTESIDVTAVTADSKTNNGKGNNKSNMSKAEAITNGLDLPGNSEKGIQNALNNGQGNKYGIYKRLEREGYAVTDSGDIVIGDGSTSSVTPTLNGSNNRPEEHQIYYYHGDHLGSSNIISDRKGRSYEHLEYFPYGETWVEESRNTTHLPYRFTGKELDPETGLYYFGARYYDPKVSVWVSVDPALGRYLPTPGVFAGYLPGLGGAFNPVNMNVYNYAGINPVKYTDPDGNAFIFGAIVGAALDVGFQVAMMSLDMQDEFDFTSVVVSAAGGAVGAGLLTKIDKIKKLGTYGKKALELAAETGMDVASKAVKGEKITVEGVLTDVALGEVAGGLGDTAAKKAKTKMTASSENKLLEVAADRAERIANNPKVGRPEARSKQSKAARSKQQAFVEGAGASAGTVTSGVAGRILDLGVGGIVGEESN